MRKKLLLLAPLLAFPMLGVRNRASLPPPPPTYANEVSRILQQHCQSCHHLGDIAPFSLMSYQDAAIRAEEIKAATRARIMPPWKAAAGCGEFSGTRAITQREIDILGQWADAGAPMGNVKDMPPARVFDGGWSAGTPDIVLSMPVPFIPPSDRDEYRCFSMPVDRDTDVQISMIDFLPGDRTTVHHIVPFLDPTGKSANLDRDGKGFQCFGGPLLDDTSPLGGWSPGARPTRLPEGTAMRLPRGSRVVMQVHYHPHFGKVLPDQTQIGLYLAEGPVKRQLHYDFVANTSLVIPPGAPETTITASVNVPRDVDIVSVYPHMHLLGKSMKVEAVMPDGSKQCMVDVPQYDFNWQNQYVYRTPLRVKGGGRIEVTATYDNSADNPRNPNNPPREVRWGEASTDEMCVALIGYTMADE